MIRNNWKINVQKFGSFMSKMIMPLIGIFIAWGLWTAFFLYNVDAETGTKSIGWLGKDTIMKQIIGPTFKYLIPILIGFISGKTIYKDRGGFFAAFIVLFCIISCDQMFAKNGILGHTLIAKNSKYQGPNQLVGAMIWGPLSAFIFKKIEESYINKIKTGFEMLVKNFGFAIIAIGLGMFVFWTWPFVIYGISWIMLKIVNFFTNIPWAYPFLAIFTEPIRAMFLNNALNYGVMVPLGEFEKSISGFSKYFMVAGNAGPGFGLLIAFTIWRKKQRAATSSASIIQLFGGIHEVHYVYLLAEPIFIFSTICGAATGMAMIALLGGGTISAVSPGSIISVIAMSPNAKLIAINVISVLMSALVTFGVATLIIMLQNKNTKKIKSDSNDINVYNNTNDGLKIKNAKTLFVACDAGVGSSAMGATIIRKWVKDNNLDIIVSNCAIRDLPEDTNIVVTMFGFYELAQKKCPKAFIYPIDKFLGNDVYEKLFNLILKNKDLNKKKE